MQAVVNAMNVQRRPHLEIMKAGIREAAAYCRKDFDQQKPDCRLYEFGEQVVAGKQT